MKEKIVIIIPTYNEALIIEDAIHQVFKAVEDAEEYEVHVLIFDSASQDDTQNLVIRLHRTYDKLHLQTERQKSGLGASYHAAMHYAMDELGADIVVEFDADLSHQPKYLMTMFKKMAKYDVVLGSRYVKGGSIPNNWAWHRKILSKAGSFIARLVLARKYKDFTSGFRATRTSVLRKVLPARFLSSNFAYKLELLYLLHLSNARIVEIPIDFIDRYRGKSKMAPHQVFDSLRVIFQLRWHKLTQYFLMCSVGITGMVIQMMAYNLFRLIINPIFATKIAVILALINNFILNNRYTFANKSPTHVYKKQMFVFYIALSIATIILQAKWLQFTLALYGTGFWQENIPVLVGVVLGSILNYFVYSKVIWKYRSNPA